MAIGHFAIRLQQRSKGHTATAGIAYRCGLDLHDERTGKTAPIRRSGARSDGRSHGTRTPRTAIHDQRRHGVQVLPVGGEP